MSYTNLITENAPAPPFPSLYWPFHADPGDAQYLDSVSSIWRFTLFWTLITVCSAHFVVALWAMMMQIASAFHRAAYLRDPRVAKRLSGKNRKLLGEHPVKSTLTYVWVIMAVYLAIGAIEAFVAGSLVGVILGALYDAGYFRMSTWTPFIWSIINMLILIVASFRIQGGL